jgi:hypothetical protein
VGEGGGNFRKNTFYIMILILKDEVCDLYYHDMSQFLHIFAKKIIKFLLTWNSNLRGCTEKMIH